jgi:DNA-binding NarL/FixJ family response regulator
MRIVIADDSVLLREGLARVLAENGYEIVAQVGDAAALREAVENLGPELAIVDVRMPPTYEDEGLLAAVEIRRLHPGMGILVLSQHVEGRHAVELVGSGGGFGYLLKDRVLDVDDFLEASERVCRGGSALDPEVVKQLLTPPREDDALAALTPREREVIGLMAEGKNNAGIAKQLWLTEKTVETHVSSILGKLDLPPDSDTNRRVLAVVTYLRRTSPA